MMTKEQFVDMMIITEKFMAEVDKWDDFGLQIFDKPIVELPWEMFDLFLSTHFDEDGMDWIHWYLFERVGYNGEILSCWDENDKEFIVKDPEDLWKLVEIHLLNRNE